MKHIEVSRKIVLSKEVSSDDLKKAFLERLERAVEIENIKGGAEHFHVSGTTGAPVSMTRSARLDLDVTIAMDQGTARILIDGYVRTAMSLTMLYGALFFVLLCVGLLPGFVDTSIDGDAADALVFVLIGMFLVYDINRRLEEPREYLNQTLDSLNTLFS
ncbi:MAG: hypothetical protein ACK4NR_00400 [Micavibrio sp.]